MNFSRILLLGVWAMLIVPNVQGQTRLTNEQQLAIQQELNSFDVSRAATEVEAQSQTGDKKQAQSEFTNFAAILGKASPALLAMGLSGHYSYSPESPQDIQKLQALNCGRAALKYLQEERDGGATLFTTIHIYTAKFFGYNYPVFFATQSGASTQTLIFFKGTDVKRIYRSCTGPSVYEIDYSF